MLFFSFRDVRERERERERENKTFLLYEDMLRERLVSKFNNTLRTLRSGADNAD